MAKLLIGPMDKGLRNDVTAFNVDNQSFPVLFNAYQWRGRAKRKRGTELLGRLTRYFDSLNTSAVFNPGSTTQTLSSGAGNLLTGFSGSGINAEASIVPGTVTIHDQTAPQTYTDPSEDGTLSGSTGGSGTINYATGAITISGGASHTIDANFDYYPSLPVLGLESFISDVTQAPFTIGFDTTYSYDISSSSPYPIHSVSFYWNPPSSGTYVQKTSWTPVNWNLQDYQQVWSNNYSNSMWATPGITSPLSLTNIGMQFKPIATVTVGSATTATLQITGHGLSIGDYLFINEVATTTGINFQTGYVTTVTDANNVIVTFPSATLATNGTGGIAQYLTRSADSTKDCIRWYNGSPVSSAIPPSFSTAGGWVNFCPPLSLASYPISNLIAAQYYLVGAKIIIPFKDRILFMGVVLQTSSGSKYYLQDTVVYSQNGSPYYTASFPYSTVQPTIPVLITAAKTPLLVPTGQQGLPYSFFEDAQGFGGFVDAGYSRPITSASPNEDVLIVGFSDRQSQLVYQGNDVLPFAFFIVNSELGSDATFSAITLDRGVLSVGGRGIILTDQVSSQRIDLEMPDEIFRIKISNAGDKRVTAQRDFITEWVYFSYPYSAQKTRYPSRTFQYNYRDGSWAIFGENYTSYGAFRKKTGNTWATIGKIVGTWQNWNEPWNSGAGNLEQPLVIAGNQQGFVLIRSSETTGEGSSLQIESISSSTITSTDHGLSTGDYIQIKDCLGTIGPQINNRVYSVLVLTEDTFVLNPTIASGYTYLGNGTIIRFYRPLIKSKQFPTAWEMSRKTRLGAQQYLLTGTDIGQVTLLIYLSQNDDFAYNLPPIVPSPLSTNNALVYSTVLYTCPETTNLGLTVAESNLQLLTAPTQQQIWHRMNTSLIGDTVQIGITLSDEQMGSLSEVGLSYPITAATNATNCVITTTANFPVGTLVKISDVQGMTNLNFSSSQGNYYYVTATSSSSMTLSVDSTGFSSYTSGGEVVAAAPVFQTDEIELHSFILDVNPSQLLA